MIEQQEETAKMPSIIKTENELLPQLKITSLLLGQGKTNNSNLVSVLEDTSNLYLEVNIETINNVTSLDKIIQDNEYYKYIQISVSIEPQQLSTTKIRKNLLNSSGQINLQNKFVLTDINLDTFSLKIEQSFDFDSFASDNRISSEQKQLLVNVYGTTQSIIYPILLNKKIVKIFDNAENSVLVDKRFLDGLDTLQENLKLKNYENINLYTSYFGQNFYQTHNNINLTSFIVFDYQSFLRETSYFIENALEDYSYTIEIIKNNNLIDVINISFNNNNVSFISEKAVSVLHNFESKLLFSVNENMESLSTKTTNIYELNVTNKDKTFINFYNRLTNAGEFVDLRNSYDQLKNVINFAATRMDETKNIYYLDPVTLKFQEDFILFYQQKENYYNSIFNSFRINININQFLTSILKIYNKFSANIITDEQIQDVVSLLVLQNTSYDLWQRMFNTLDKLFSTLQSFLYDITVNPSIRRSKIFRTETTKSNYYYSISDKINYTLFPIIDFSYLRDNFNADDRSSVANYFINNSNVLKINSTTDYSSEEYNRVNSYLNTKISAVNKPNYIGEFKNLEQYGLTVEYTNPYTTSFTSGSFKVNFNNENLVKERSLIKPTETLGSNTVTKVPVVKTNLLSVESVKDLDDNNKKLLSTKNQMSLSIANGIHINTLNNKSISPKLIFNRYNFEANEWSLIDDLKQIKNNDLIQIVTYEAPSIFLINKIGIEKIDLVNTYFIVNGIT
jgi:hypothetical protein